MKFQAHQTLWTKYCGIINLSQSQNMELIQQSDDQRFLLVKLTWSDESIQPIFILNLYAPASNAADRNVFFSSVIHQLNSLDSSNTIIQNLFIAGDFNFSFDNNSYHNTRRSNLPQHFLRFMLSQFEDCINHVEDGISYRPTFRRADSSTCIDYIFANKSIHNNCNNGNVEYMNKEWTDHALLSINLTIGTSSTGKGLWRANPNLAKNPAYIRKLNEQIEQYITHKLAKYNNSPQEKWDLLKKMVKKVTQNFCRNRCQWRNDRIKQLQSQRNDIFRRYSDNPTCLNILLPEVENKLAKLQTEIAEIDILRAGKRWIENNEKSAGYLKRTAESRNIKRNITKLVHPETDLECLDIKAKLDAASNFYSTLYSAEPIDHQDLESMLNTIDKQVSSNDAKHIISSISFDDILDGSRRTPHKSSPGMDGLPYEILNLIIGHPSCKSLVLEVYNDAINKALFPKSWQQTCLVLLPKTGDLTSLSNWRPISLINTDCKVFTRIMNSRIMDISSKLITRFQSGFMHNRFIGDHGFACRLIMEDASKSTSISESLGVMLDQTKAYDRIHPEYLCKVLKRFGFPDKFIKCIHDLFFGNSISVNVNGSLADSIQQLRGLRQGDSISPILFNLAIEPFLLSILNNEIIDGYCLKARRSNSDLQLTAPRPVKLLAYADDILIFINSKEEFLELQECLKVYNGASNSQVNYSKSVAFPLAGGTTFNNRELKDLIIHNGLRWFDSQSLGYIKYLGYPIWFTNDQRTIFHKETIRKLESSVNIHSQRQLSVYGRAHLANTLILSKLWHFLRITSLPKSFYNKVSSIVYQFVTHNLFPRIARTTLEQPKNKGGVSLLNVEVQQKVFQFRYINPLLLNSRQRIPDFLYKMLIFTLQSSFDTPSHVIPLIFKHSRSHGNMKGLHPLIPMFSALDSCPRHPTENDLMISAQTSLLVPFKDICEEVPQENFKFSKFLQTQKAYHFFERDFLSNGLQFKNRQHCGSPNLLQKIKNAVLTGNLTFKPYFASLLSAEQHDLEFDNEGNPIESSINFDPFIQQMSYDDINITALKNRQLKTMFSFNSNSQITNISHNNWKAFISSPMHHIPRNVWYRLLHKKLSTRANLHRIIPAKVDDDLCQLCKLPETEQHMLFTCIQKQDLWNAAFKKYLSNPKDPSCSSIFEDLSTLRLSKYYILHYHDKFTIYDFFATVIRFIWKAHWQQFFEQTPILDEIVLNQIQKELLKLSAYNSLF